MTELSVVVPVYNEEGAIETLVDDLGSVLTPLFDELQVIVVDDASTDETPAILERLAHERPWLDVVRASSNAGHGPSVVRGLELARAEWIFQIDSDGQFVVAEFPRLWERRANGDLVLGVRQNRRDPRHRLLLSRSVRLATSLLVGARMRDVNTPFRLVRRSVWEDLRPLIGSSTLAPNIFVAVGARVRGWRVVELPATHRPRVTGTGSLRALRLVRFSLRALGQLLAFRVRLRRLPAREAS
ncbi:MAG TPA: glycosyltransferase family 2 protein [Gaiellaceae bacterium]|nr:glycosyltransferase family 2 protein [Gaiellaceae bacterium]